MRVCARDHGTFLHNIHALGLSNFQAKDLLSRMPLRQLKDYFGEFLCEAAARGCVQGEEEARDPQRPALGKSWRDWSREELEYEKKFLREHHSLAPYVASRYWPSTSHNLADPTYFAEPRARRNAREY